MLNKDIYPYDPIATAVLNALETSKKFIGLNYLAKVKKTKTAKKFTLYQYKDGNKLAGNRGIGSTAQRLDIQRGRQLDVEMLDMLVETIINQSELNAKNLIDWQTGKKATASSAQTTARLKNKLAIEGRLEYAFWESARLGTISAIANVDQGEVSIDFNVSGHTIASTTTADWDSLGGDMAGDLATLITTLSEANIEDIVVFYNATTGKVIYDAAKGDFGTISEEFKKDLTYGKPGIVPNGFMGLNWVKANHSYLNASGTATKFLTDYYIYMMPKNAAQAWELDGAPNNNTGKPGFVSHNYKTPGMPFDIVEQAAMTALPSLVNPWAIQCFKIRV